MGYSKKDPQGTVSKLINTFLDIAGRALRRSKNPKNPHPERDRAKYDEMMHKIEKVAKNAPNLPKK